MTNGGYVTWPQLEDTLRDFAERLAALEAKDKAEETEKGARASRLWTIGLLVCSGVVFPILVTAVITYLHLRSYH